MNASTCSEMAACASYAMTDAFTRAEVAARTLKPGDTFAGAYALIASIGFPNGHPYESFALAGALVGLGVSFHDGEAIDARECITDARDIIISIKEA